MKRFRWQLLIIFLTGLVVGILLLGEQPKTPVLLATPEPNQGGVYTEGLVGHLQRMNPVLDFYNPVDREVDRLLYSGILKFDGQGQPQGDLADSWGISKDGTIYNFSLRQGVTWHDGNPLTSDDEGIER
jgi:peptide/nickel transport system substrate-binding protein